MNQWVEKYPETDYKEEQLQFYNQLNQPAKVLELGERIVGKDPKDLTALYLMTLNIAKLAEATLDQLAMGQKTARGLLDNLDTFFAAEKKPATTSDADWKKARTSIETVAKGTLVWIVMKPGVDAVAKKDYETAEQIFTKVLQQYPDSGQAAYSLGSTLVSQRKPEKFPQAIYEIARSAAMDPEKGGLADPKVRANVDAYLSKVYAQYHGGDDEGLKQLKVLALQSPFPPPDFKLKSAAEIATEKEEEFRKSNPQLALWMGVKKYLTDTNGDQYFDSQMKGAALPKLKGTLVEAKPACRSKQLLVAISDATHAEVTLKLDAALTGKPETGAEIQWEGVPSAFTKDPFNLTIDAQKTKIEGAKVTPCAPQAPRKRAGKKK